MHLLIPFASSVSEAASQVLRGLALPRLGQLLGEMTLLHRDDADSSTLSPPHERALAQAVGWHGADGCLPFASQAASRDGIDLAGLPWGLVTPVHWHVGQHHVSLADPQALHLGEAESRAAFAAVRELFESEGFRFEWGAPLRWYASHECLAGVPCASLDRVIGRNVEFWTMAGLARSASAGLIARLQSEWQLLLYTHPLNEAREERGELTLNSFWLSGCGPPQDQRGEAPQVDESLRAPLLAEDWAAWADAWRALDAGKVAMALEAVRARRPFALTLCGDRNGHRYGRAPLSLSQRLGRAWRPSNPQRVLEAL